jgi:hypothetical protein
MARKTKGESDVVVELRFLEPVYQHLHGFIEGMCDCGTSEADYLAEVPDMPYSFVKKIEGPKRVR